MYISYIVGQFGPTRNVSSVTRGQLQGDSNGMTESILDAAKQVAEIIDWLKQHTGLVSRWNGRIHTSDDIDINGLPAFSAKKEWDCEIAVHQSVLQTSGLFETLVHECLHSVSVGMEPLPYFRYRGYEEGTVELATRLLGPQIAISMKFPGAFDSRVSYNRYVQLLEKLRMETGKDEQDFTLALLRTPLAYREQTVVEWVTNNNPQEAPVRALARIAALQRELRGQR